MNRLGLPTNSLVNDLRAAIGAAFVLTQSEELRVYETDAGRMTRSLPGVVTLPKSTEEVVEIAKITQRFQRSLTARGSGTGLMGGAIASQGGVVVSTARMNSILEIDVANRVAVIQPGVTNAWLCQQAYPYGLYFPPDPISQSASSLGGYAALDMSGPHSLKYGSTSSHILGIEMVLADGQLLRVGGKVLESPGLDWVGLIVGSEGTFGIITRLVVRLLPIPPTTRTFVIVFDRLSDAAEAAISLLARGLIPAALELLDSTVLAVLMNTYPRWQTMLQGTRFNEKQGLLLIDLDGVKDPATGLETQEKVLQGVCQELKALLCYSAKDAEERTFFWQAYHQAVGATGRLANAYFLQDGVVPLSKLPEVVSRLRALGRSYGLKVGYLIHAGDGHLLPLLLYDKKDPEQINQVRQCGLEMMQIFMAVGGNIGGTAGIGLEKREALSRFFQPLELEAMKKIRAVFDPEALCNPDKIFL
jgi:glycolate oxidase